MIELYLFLALTTSITTFIRIGYPAIQSIRDRQPENDISEYWIISSMVFIIAGVILAPLFILLLIDWQLHESFQESLTRAMLD